MAVLFSSTRWTGNPPEINLTGEYEIGARTAETVQVRLKLTISPVTGIRYFGYNILARIQLAGANVSDWITIKANQPSQWTSPIVTYFPSASGWYTVNQAAASTSMTGTVCMDSNTGTRTANYSGTVTFPTGNTAPVWSSKVSSLTHKGIIPENIRSSTFSWGAAYDAQGDQIQYRVRYFIGGTDKGIFGTDNLTSRSIGFDPRGYIGEGQSMYFRVYCKDPYTDYGNDYVQSDTITINSMTQAAITAIQPIDFDTSSFTLTRGSGKNSNGVATGFKYALTCSACTVYNAASINETTNIAVYKSGSLPTEPYIKFSDLQSWLAARGYAADITFTLTTTNSYGTSKTSSKTVTADIRKNPTPPGIPVLSGKYTINGAEYWIINRRGIDLSWFSSADPNGTAVTYTVQYSINNGSWTDYLTTDKTTAVYAPYSITSQRSIRFRIAAKNKYGYVTVGAETEPQTLHYWNPITISNLTIDRQTGSYTLSGQIKQNTSVMSSLRSLSVNMYKQDPTETLVGTWDKSFENGASSSNFSITVTSVGGVPVIETDTYLLQIRAHDGVQKEVFAVPDVTENMMLSRYSALFTIREKGVGVNAVAGSFADFITNGTASIYGGNGSGDGDGSVNLAVANNSFLNWYIGCYQDAQGALRSSYDSPANTTTCFRQIQAYFGENGTVVPLRHRWIYPSNKASVLKDDVIPAPEYTSWVTFVDSSSESLKAARSAMGLGNTTGALPAANGGTGQTSLQAARSAMGLGNTTGALPVANGGTGLAALSSGSALIGNGTGAVLARGITDMTSKNYITYNTNLMTTNTLAYWNGACSSANSSNLTYGACGTLYGSNTMAWKVTSVTMSSSGMGSFSASGVTTNSTILVIRKASTTDNTGNYGTLGAASCASNGTIRVHTAAGTSNSSTTYNVFAWWSK